MTLTVIGTTNGLFEASDAVILSAPLYVPAVKVPGLTTTLKTADVEVPEPVTVNQLPPVVVVVETVKPRGRIELDRVRLWAGGDASPIL